VHQSLEDIVVPTASIPDYMKDLKELAEKNRVSIPYYGHTGDGNLRATVLKPNSWSKDEWLKKLDAILTELYRITAGYGGEISGEHGIGSKRKKYITINLSKSTVELMKSIKKAFDPNNILNPGKIFPDT